MFVRTCVKKYGAGVGDEASQGKVFSSGFTSVMPNGKIPLTPPDRFRTLCAIRWCNESHCEWSRDWPDDATATG